MKKYPFKILIFIWLSIQLLALANLKADDSKNSTAAKEIKILAIGNSFTLNACRNLAEITSSTRDYQIEITTATIGGSSLQQHADLITECENDDRLKPYADQYNLRELLEKDTYDYVTIQQVSNLSFVADSYQPHGNKLIAYIRKHAPSAQILIHQTWAYSSACPRLPKWDMTRDEMHSKLVRSYAEFATEVGLEIIPSGQAFYKAFEQQPDVYLWKDDGYHANPTGEYLAGLVWFGVLFDTSPKKVKYRPETVGQDTARFLRSIANKQIQSD